MSEITMDQVIEAVAKTVFGKLDGGKTVWGGSELDDIVEGPIEIHDGSTSRFRSVTFRTLDGDQWQVEVAIQRVQRIRRATVQREITSGSG